ncbi:MAG: hypothetical protein FWD14_07605 [Treponema sp.]|nr:hypothetical protein [Treponema sp.]
MDLIGLLDRIVIGAESISEGRKNLAINGSEHAGRLFYEEGIAISFDTFKNAQSSVDPRIMILIELTFLQQELQFCNEADTITQSSLTQAIQSFEDALRCLKTVEDSMLYKGVETSYPTAQKHRFHGFPRDAVHLACDSHKTRLQNSQRTPGINMIEKAVLTQRISNMKTIQTAYTEKQKNALGE